MTDHFYSNVARRGDVIHVTGWDDDGNRVNEIFGWAPRVWMPTNKETGWKTIHGEPLREIQCESLSAMKEVVDSYKSTNINLYGNRRTLSQFLVENYADQTPNIQMIRRGFIDIEVAVVDGFPDIEEANDPINAVAIAYAGKVYGWGLGECDPASSSVAFKLTPVYEECSNELQLLSRVIDFVTRNNLDLLSGWNSSGFDLPYMVNRVGKVLGRDGLKRFSAHPSLPAKTREYMNMGKMQHKASIFGIADLDLLELYKKFAMTKHPSYKLENVAMYEVGEGKYEVDSDEPMHMLYKTDFNSFMIYNMKDAELVYRMDQKHKFIDLTIMLAYQNMTNFDDIFSQMRCWESYIAKYLYERKVIVPLSQGLDSDVAEQFEATGIEGAYVMEPLLGLKEWCVSFDYDSLYPNIIRMLNISPECLVPEHELIVDKTVEDHLKATPGDRLVPRDSGFSHAINGVLYRKDVTGFIPEIIAGLYGDRVSAKKRMKEAKIEAAKIRKELLERGVTV